MTEILESTTCADCGAATVNDSRGSGTRVPCMVCGSMKRIHKVSITENIVARDGHGLKAKRPGQKKPYVEELSMPDYSYSRGKHFHKQRVIDRGNDQYSEKVTDYETGEVFHHCEEPLSQHQGMAMRSARTIKANPSGKRTGLRPAAYLFR